MWSRRLATLAVQILVFAVLAEATALVLYYYDTGWLYYRHHREYPLIPETARGALSADVLHPYFGPTHRVGIRPETNNIGFGSALSYPFAKTSDNQFTIGIFGGSVARLFCDRGVPRMVADLRQNAAFATREIIPLCFAHEGYKQPQQLLVLAYFLSLGQRFDVAVNIDGFNEVALGSYNNDRGRDISMPSPLHLDPIINLIDRSTLTPQAVYSLAAISRDKERLNALALRLQTTRLASVAFVLGKLYDYTRHDYDAEVARFAQISSAPSTASMIQLTPPIHPRSGARLYDDIADGWVSASLLMHDMLAARGTPYLHVLQPNQYDSRHVFGPEEARVALNPSTGFKPPVEQGYPVLRQAASRLAARLPFFDATGLFDQEPAAVYEDDCCHYNARGNELLGAYVAARISEVMRQPAVPR